MQMADPRVSNFPLPLNYLRVRLNACAYSLLPIPNYRLLRNLSSALWSLVIMFPTIVLVAFFATVTNAKGACYVPNGIDRHSLSNIGDNDYDPCEKDGVSMCCNTHNKDRCQRSGLCWEPSSNVLWRGSCTDQTWESPGCLKLCISPNETGK